MRNRKLSHKNLIFKLSTLSLLLTLATACTPLFPPQPKTEQNIFFLSDITKFEAAKRQDINLVIEEVEISAGLDSNRIAKTSQNSLSYYDGSKWAETLDEVVLSTLTESFENSNKFESVTSELHGIRGDYAISINVRDFQVENSDTAKVKIVTKLISLPNRQVLMNFVSSSNKDVSESSVSNAVSELNAAFTNVQTDIVEKVSKFMEQNNTGLAQ